MFGPPMIPKPRKDDYFRPDTLEIVQLIKQIKESIDVIMENPKLHPAARGYLQGCKDKIDQAAMSAHHAGNL